MECTWSCAIWDIRSKSREILSAHNLFRSCAIALKFCTEHHSGTAVLRAKLQNNCTIGMKRMLWTNEILQNFSLRWVSGKYNTHLYHDDVIKWKYFPRCWPFVRGSHRWIPLKKGQWRGALMFSLMCAWTNGWVNNRVAGDLSCNRSQYDVTVMYPPPLQ